MLSPFIVNDRNLYLARYPENQVTRSLQAWDSADEYLINYVNDNALVTSKSRILIVNDSFGALTLSFPENDVFSVSDSFISQSGIIENAEHNGVSLTNIELINSLSPLPDNIDLVLYKLPKSNNLLVEQLRLIRRNYNESVHFIAADKVKNIHSSTLKYFERFLGTTTTSLAVKKSRLVFSALNSEPDEKTLPSVKYWHTDNTNYEIANFANVFARDKLDIGARFLLEHLPSVNKNAQVIDLGCGNGVLGLHMLANQPQANIHFSDESYMAIASAKATIERNLPDLLKQCHFTVNDCLTDIATESADIIVCNPPFHQQNATTDHIAWQMFNDCHRVLKQRGKLTIVGNRQLGYHIKLKRIFGNAKLIASNKKFVIITAEKQ
ncbi:methyltransferase [Thalassotalea sediminis]|uniref:methyltransferase n=1 Tax=Thalassotalea sediminis TaxID=1759089 RepID=UPI00257267D8|nr:methyltransferase [Thalassotalea sediminis]